MRLPRAAGMTTVRASAGAASLTIEVPTGVAARIKSRMAIGSSQVDERAVPALRGRLRVAGLRHRDQPRRHRPLGRRRLGAGRGDGVAWPSIPPPRPTAGRSRRWLEGRGEYELFACDPALADTAAFCAAYGFAPEDSANTIVVIGKSDPPVFAACVVLATHRLDVNRTSRSGSGAQGLVRLTGRDPGADRDGDRRGDGVRSAGRSAALGRCGGDGPRADRPRRRQPLVEGHRAAVDPADPAERRGRRGARGAPRRPRPEA